MFNVSNRLVATIMTLILNSLHPNSHFKVVVFITNGSCHTGTVVSIIYLSQVDLGSLKDTVPADRIVTLQGGRGPFGKGSAGELLLQLTYKAYVEDEEDEVIRGRSTHADASDDDLAESEVDNAT